MFNWPNFITLLDPSIVAMAACLGVAFGFALASVNQHGGVLFYWMAASGVVFFASLAVIRFLQGSEVWERWLSVLVLWLVYSVAAYWGDRLHRRLFTRTP